MATYNLQHICNSYFLNFPALCDFLLANNGFISGSCALACFVYFPSFSDIKIYVPREAMIKEVNKIFIDREIKISRNKLPDGGYKFIINSQTSCPFSTKYVYTIIDAQKYTDMLDIDCSGIRFNGKSWDLSSLDLNDLWTTRRCKLVKPFKYVIEYDPEDEIYKLIKVVIDNKLNLENIPTNQREILNCILPRVLVMRIYELHLLNENRVRKGLNQASWLPDLTRQMISTDWNYNVCLKNCLIHLNLGDTNLADERTGTVVYQYIRMAKYILYGFVFTNLADLPQLFK